MRILLAAVGRLKVGAERQLYEHYAARFEAAGRGQGLGPLRLTELPEGRSSERDARTSDEAQRLMAAVADASVRIALDERGKALGSEEFARLLARFRDDGTKSLAFLIGGPDGHHGTVQGAATLRLSLGAMTLPHGLARVVLVEQIYRAATILSGHPYHRA